MGALCSWLPVRAHARLELVDHLSDLLPLGQGLGDVQRLFHAHFLLLYVSLIDEMILNQDGTAVKGFHPVVPGGILSVLSRWIKITVTVECRYRHKGP